VRSRPSVQQSRFGKALGNPFNVFLPKGLSAEMFAKRVFLIDIHELAPDATGLVELTEMAKSGSERGARKIRLWHEENPLPKKGRRCFVLAGQRYAMPRK
jgi:hypothetical protein